MAISLPELKPTSTSNLLGGDLVDVITELPETLNKTLNVDLPFGQLILSLVLLSIYGVITFVCIRFVRGKSETLTDTQRLWINRIKNGTLGVLVVALLLVWAPEMQTLALSLTAAAVAITIATKELILCLTGHIYRVTTAQFKVGDWIVMGEVNGEVVETSVMNFQVQEICGISCENTGQIITVPNSKLLSEHVIIRTSLKRYIFHNFQIHIQAAQMQIPVTEVMALLESTAQKVLASTVKDSTLNLRLIEKRTAMRLPSSKPLIMVRTSTFDQITFDIRIFTPRLLAKRAESDITAGFLDAIFSHRYNDERTDNTPKTTSDKSDSMEDSKTHAA